MHLQTFFASCKDAFTINKRTPFSVACRKGYFLFLLVLSMLMITVLWSYFYVSADTHQKGYILEQEQMKRENLETATRFLEQDVVNANNLDNLMNRSVLKKMKKPVGMKFSKIQTRVSRRP